MKVIFLDIDGVLNFNGCRDKIGGLYFVNESKIKLLKQIVDETDAKIVLSSTWRKGWFHRDQGFTDGWADDFTALENKLAEYGLTFISRTPITSEGYRGTEIDMWLKNWKGEEVTNFIIIDDDTDMKPHMDRLVQTSFNSGLLEKHVNKAIKMLME
jgi:hypothetical protein